MADTTPQFLTSAQLEIAPSPSQCLFAFLDGFFVGKGSCVMGCDLEGIISHLHTKSALFKKSHAVQIYYYFCLYFHFAPLLCLDFHFAPLLSLDFSLRPTSQFGFFTLPHFSFWIFTLPHFSVWIFTSPHFSVWIFHFAPLLCLDFHLANQNPNEKVRQSEKSKQKSEAK